MWILSAKGTCLLQRIHLCWGVQLHALVKWSLEIREGKLITWEQTRDIASGNVLIIHVPGMISGQWSVVWPGCQLPGFLWPQPPHQVALLKSFSSMIGPIMPIPDQQFWGRHHSTRDYPAWELTHNSSCLQRLRLPTFLILLRVVHFSRGHQQEDHGSNGNGVRSYTAPEFSNSFRRKEDHVFRLEDPNVNLHLPLLGEGTSQVVTNTDLRTIRIYGS